MNQPTHNPTVQLGCGTLIVIAIIVAVFSQSGVRNELRSIENRLDRIEKILLSRSATAAAAPQPDDNSGTSLPTNPDPNGRGDAGTARDADPAKAADGSK